MEKLTQFIQNAIQVVLATIRRPGKSSSILRSSSKEQPNQQNPIQAELAKAKNTNERIEQLEIQIQELTENSKKINISSTYKFVLILATILTLASLLAAVSLAANDSANDQQKAILTACTTAWQMGFGAIIGLIGGKAS